MVSSAEGQQHVCFLHNFVLCPCIHPPRQRFHSFADNIWRVKGGQQWKLNTTERQVLRVSWYHHNSYVHHIWILLHTYRSLLPIKSMPITMPIYWCLFFIISLSHIIPHLMKFLTSSFTPCTKKKQNNIPAGSLSLHSCNQQRCSLTPLSRALIRLDCIALPEGCYDHLVFFFYLLLLNRDREQRDPLIESDRPVLVNWSRFSSRPFVLSPLLASSVPLLALTFLFSSVAAFYLKSEVRVQSVTL